MNIDNLKYIEQDFEKMKWNIFLTPLHENVLDVFDSLAAIFKSAMQPLKECTAITTDQLVRYIIYCYHFNSPVAREDNLLLRKRDALILSGVEPDANGNYSAEIMKIVAHSDEAANYCIMHFLKHENKLDWIELQAKLSVYYQVLELLMAESQLAGTKTVEDVMDKKLSVSKKLSEIKSDIDKLKAIAFNKDTEYVNLVTSFEELENELVLYPEQFVKSKLKQLSLQ
jgi:hypothetical protein